ncbi:MAG: tRNA pseudouridine(55) synthase TruB [Lachnospiraceae bacterium]|nr:tRNA pseudouridine(55) synthase TruB [Lachnospiraceae bacterium]
MQSGIINIYKERGYTSFKVISVLRSIYNIKKIGHCGTLDPDAEGVLPVCIGKATKVCGLLTDASKEYRATLRLGICTDTEDMTGTVLSESAVECSEDEIRSAILSFKGDIEQIPPMYSALKKDGKKLYEYAREGKEIERKPRSVTIFDINIDDINLPEVTFTVSCSKGTYIRSLCRDIGEKLGCGGCMAALVRTKHSGFMIEDAVTTDFLNEKKEAGEDVFSFLIPTDSVFMDYPRLDLNDGAVKNALNGGSLLPDDFSDYTDFSGKCRVYLPDGSFLGLYKRAGNIIKLDTYFYEG